MDGPPPEGPKRKTIAHFDLPGHAHALTFSCFGHRPLLLRDEWRRMLSTSIDRAMEGHRFDLLGFVYMPDHVHLVVFPKAVTSRIAGLLYAIKRPFSFRVKEALVAAGDPLLDELTVQERPGKMVFRFWQEGPGYDRNIRSSEALRAELGYIHANPVKRGLCERPGDWLWSSWGHYFGEGAARGAIAGLPRVGQGRGPSDSSSAALA